jgi:hypothetical protein
MPASEGRLATLSWLAMYAFSGLGRQGASSAVLQRLSADFSEHERPVNILCMDGGGMKGLSLLTIVEELEEMLGGPLGSYFDLIAGTSIGGCGALFMSRYPGPGEASRMSRLALEELRGRCFSDMSPVRLLSEGYLCADARDNLVREICGLRPLRTSGPRAFAVRAAAPAAIIRRLILRHRRRPGCAR